MPDDRLRPWPPRLGAPSRRTAGLAGLLLGLALVTSACGDPAETGLPAPAGLTGGWSTAGCALSREPHTTTFGDLTMLATPPDLEAVMARIERSGRAEFADSYAGLEVDQKGVKAIVYRVPNAAFDDVIRQTAENTCVEVRDAAHAYTELAAWQERVTADLDVWSARGVQIFTVGARHDGAGVELGVRDVAAIREALLHRYGHQAPLIFVEQGPVTPLASGSATNPATGPAPAPRPAGPPEAPAPGG